MRLTYRIIEKVATGGMAEVYLAINEHNPQSPKTIYHQAVMNNFVIAVDRRIERPHHPSKSFDRHFDPSTKPPRRSQQNLLNAHETEVTGLRLVAGCRPNAPVS